MVWWVHHMVIWRQGLWIKAQGLGQGWTRPAGRAPGRPGDIGNASLFVGKKCDGYVGFVCSSPSSWWALNEWWLLACSAENFAFRWAEGNIPQVPHSTHLVAYLQHYTHFVWKMTITTPFLCPHNSTRFFNPQTTQHGPCGPRSFSIRASKVNIGIPEPMFHVIVHNIEPLPCINWFLTYDTPSPVNPSLRARKWLGSVRTPVSISSHCFERKGGINLQYHTFQEAFTWVWMETPIHGNLLCTGL